MPLTPAELAAIAPPIHPMTLQAQRLRNWCRQPWLSEMDRERYRKWAEGFERKAL